MDDKTVETLIDKAVELRREGILLETALKILKQAEEKLSVLEEEDHWSLMGSICHHRGCIFQAMKNFEKALEALNEACRFRKGNPIDYAYSMFQIFICKDYGKLEILETEVAEIKRSLWEAIDAACSDKDIGNFFQNLAYIESKKGNLAKAIGFYHVAELYRKRADDPRGAALTQARLGECYRAKGEHQEAEEYGRKALKYFEAFKETERIQQIKKNVFQGDHNL